MGQFIGGVGHWQAPFGKVVLAQVSPVWQGVDEDWMQPLTIEQVTRLPPLGVAV